MADHVDDPKPKKPSDADLRTLSILIDGVIAQKCRRHYEADTQEHQLSSRIAEALEHEMRGMRIGDMTVRIAVQELSDRGRGSKERQVGADLYVSIVVEDGHASVSKGMLIQSKWDSTAKSDAGRLREQCERMLRRSKDSYVWAYGPDGVSVLPANGDPLAAASRGDGDRTVGELLSDGVACTAGDPTIGRDTGKPFVESINAQLRELAVGTGLSLIARTSD